MSKDVQDKLVELLESKVETINTFTVSWFGGEPLLAFDIIESLSERFISICNKNNIKYYANMVTNGYLMSREVLERLAVIQCSSVQITIDGNQDIHNLRKPLAEGGGTYTTIIENLKNGYDLLPRVNLRINVDKNNISAGDFILDFLTENNMLDKVTPYFGKLENYNNNYDSDDCLNMCDFSVYSYDYSLRTHNNDDARIMGQYPSLKSASCCADTLNASVVDAEGVIYKCWCDIGVEGRQVGSIFKPFKPSGSIYFDYMMLDPTTSEQCKDCNFLPICMGGCPYKRVKGNNDNCTNYKYILEHVTRNTIDALKTRCKVECTNECI